MILAIDVGNTNIVLGAFRGEELVFSARCATDPDKTEDEYALLFRGILAMHKVRPEDIGGGILSSVVPVLRSTLPGAVKLLTGRTVLVVGRDVTTDLDLRVDNPAQVGSDLIVDAVAAKSLYPAPIAVLDMGTATTLSVIGADGAYLGGMIIPGLRVAVDSLSSRTAQLPHISFGPPKALIGKNTVDCMQAGAIYGCAAMMDGLVDRVEEELGRPVTAVLTGGLAPSIAPYCKREFKLQPDLLLLGLRLLYEKNTERGKTPC